MATPAFRAIGSAPQVTTTSVTVTAPSSTVVGDLLLAFVGSRNTPSSAPSGWSTVKTQALVGYTGSLTVYSKIAVSGDAGASFTFTLASSNTLSAVIGAYSNVSNIDAFAGGASSSASTAFTAPSVTASHGNELIVEVWQAQSGGNPISPQPPATKRLAQSGYSGDVPMLLLADQLQANSGNSAPAQAAAGSTSANRWAAITLALSGNVPPNAPIAPSIPDPFNRLQPLTVNPIFSDPDTGDSPSRLWARYRSATVTPTPNWTVLSQTGAGQMYTFPGSTFAADRYEFQFAYQDSQGTPSTQSALAWSQSVFATAAVPSNAPTITSPVNGAAIGSATATVTLNFPGGDAFRYYVTLADGTSLVPLTTITDPSQVAARQFTITGLANNTAIKIFAAFHDANGWTSYAESDNPVAYTPPPAPVPFVEPGFSPWNDHTYGPDVLDVIYSTPAPSGSQPPATFARVYVSLDGGVTGFLHRDATMLTPSGTFRYATPASGQNYSFRVETVADNGTTSTSTWITLTAGAYGSGVYGAGVYGGGG